MYSLYANEETSLELELCNVKSSLNDTKAKLKKAEADLEGSSNATEALAKFEEGLKICRSQKCSSRIELLTWKLTLLLLRMSLNISKGRKLVLSWSIVIG